MELLILILICIILIGLYFFLLSNGKRNKAMQELAKSYKLSYRKYNKKIPLFLSATECNFIEGELKGKKVKSSIDESILLEIKELKESGMSYNKLVVKFGIPKTTILNNLKRQVL